MEGVLSAGPAPGGVCSEAQMPPRTLLSVALRKQDLHTQPPLLEKWEGGQVLACTRAQGIAAKMAAGEVQGSEPLTQEQPSKDVGSLPASN